MGEVYRAEDLRLGREVALKMLPRHSSDEQKLRRLRAEGRALASLNHPNIASVYSIEETESGPLLVLELVEGRTLDRLIPPGGMAPDRLLELAVPLVDAVAAAHDKGITHRDLKPANVMLRSDGAVKVLDFGLARWMSTTTSTDGEALTMSIADGGVVVGTIPYMSPEQLRGGHVDARSDIFSLGVMLFELATGSRPFGGASPLLIASSILRDDPPPLRSVKAGFPDELAALIGRCLAKDPVSRYASARELRQNLHELREGPASTTETRRATGVTTAERPPSIAVLPFVNLGPNAENDYFSDGLAEELITALSPVEGLRVSSRSSSFRFRASDLDVREIGTALNVSHVLEGSVRKSLNRLRVTVQLVAVDSGFQLWSERFDRELEDVFAIQEEIAASIVGKLKLRLHELGPSGLVRRRTTSVDAYNIYLKGRFFWLKRTDHDLERARQLFEQAVSIDPRYALAHAGLADAYAISGMAEYGLLPPHVAMPRAREAALRAQALDPGLAEPPTTLAHVAAFYDWDFPRADESFRRAIGVDERYPMAHHWYACYLASVGRHAEAISAELLARERDPCAIILNKNIGTMHYYARRYDEAIAEYEKALELDPNFVRTNLFLGIAYEQKGRHHEAITLLEKAAADSGENPMCVAALGHGYALAGKPASARDALERLDQLARDRWVPALAGAVVHLGLGDAHAAFLALEQALRERSSWLVALDVDPLFDPIRLDPRFTELRRRVGLPG